jgi:hypothetical protein
MKTELLSITPEMAKIWLSSNTINRPLQRIHTTNLSNAMKKGDWKINGESIKLGDNVLIDGQHRLEACIQSGCSFDSLVVTGLSKEVFDTIDTGSKRTAANVLAINGEVNSNLLAATLRMVGSYFKGSNFLDQFSNQEIQSLLTEHPAIRESVTWYTSKKSKIMIGSVACSARYLCSLKDLDESNLFFDKVFSGEGLETGSAILALRNFLIADMSSVKKMSPPIRLTMTLKSWNLYRKGNKVSFIRMISPGKNNAFPQIN